MFKLNIKVRILALLLLMFYAGAIFCKKLKNKSDLSTPLTSDETSEHLAKCFYSGELPSNVVQEVSSKTIKQMSFSDFLDAGKSYLGPKFDAILNGASSVKENVWEFVSGILGFHTEVPNE